MHCVSSSICPSHVGARTRALFYAFFMYLPRYSVLALYWGIRPARIVCVCARASGCATRNVHVRCNYFGPRDQRCNACRGKSRRCPSTDGSLTQRIAAERVPVPRPQHSPGHAVGSRACCSARACYHNFGRLRNCRTFLKLLFRPNMR